MNTGSVTIATVPLRVGFWNLNGNLALKSTDSNFVSFVRNLSIVIVIESKLRPSDHFDLSMLGFTILARNERSGASGGVLVALRHHLIRYAEVLINTAPKEQIYIKLFGQYVIGAVYIPPRESSYFSIFDRFEYLADCIESIASKNLRYVIVGDFNARVGRSMQNFSMVDSNDIVKLPIKSLDCSVNTSGRTLLNICSRTNSVVLTGKCWGPDSTCYNVRGTSVVDTGIASMDYFSFVTNGLVGPITLSDHTPVSFDIVVNSYSESLPCVEQRELVPRKLLSSILSRPDELGRVQSIILNSPPIQHFISHIHSVFSEKRDLSKSEISSLVSNMYLTVKECAAKVFSLRKADKGNKSGTTRKLPFKVTYDLECKDARSAFRRAYRVFQRTRSTFSYNVMKHRLKIKLSNERRCRRFSEREYLNRLFLPSNSTNLWKDVRNVSPVTYDGPIDIQEYTSFLHEIAQGKFEFDKSASVNANKRLNGLFMARMAEEKQLALLDTFPIDEILKPKCGKAVGLDGWSGELIRVFAPALRQVLPQLFVICLRSGVTPEHWDLDIKIPIPKPGKPLNKPNSLRPITLVNVLMKQYEAWIITLLDEFCQSGEHQAGFKANYSCTGRLFLLRSLLDITISTKKGTYAIFIDFSSFFDTIREELLCSELLNRKVPEYLVRAIHGMLSQVRAKVFMKNKYGSSFDCRVGLRQGSRSSPKLATLYLDIITNTLLNCKGGIEIFGHTINHVFYADDLVLLFEQHEEAQDALNVLGRTCISLGLNVSVEKSFVVHFTKGRSKGIRDLCYISDPLPRYDSAKYLGCTLDKHVNFDIHLQSVRQKADRAFSLLMNFQKRYPNLDFKRFLKLYYSLVLPVYAYSAEVFCWGVGQKFDSIFVEHLRRYLNLPKNTSHQAIHFLTGTFPIQFKIYQRAYNFWFKIAELDELRFEKMAYRKLKSSTRQNWYSQMNAVFSEIGFHGDFEYWSHTWIRKEKIRFVETLVTYFSDISAKWAEASSYRFLVQNIDPKVGAVFLDFSSFWNRRTLSRFFLRGYNFEMTSGAKYKRHPHDRLCTHCLETVRSIHIGDENHYLIKCPRFVVERNKCCSALNIDPNDLMSALIDTHSIPHCSSFSVFSLLAKFIKSSFSHLADPYNDAT